MSKSCPIYGKAIYADCLECEDKPCKKQKKYKKVIIGIDQSYKNTGISIVADGKLAKVTSKELEHYKNNSDKRRALRKTLDGLLRSVTQKSESIVCIIERIRLRSQGFLNINYIKSIGALNSLIVDIMNEYSVEVYSVDTRCWKAQVIGTSKPGPANNKFNMEPEKFPTFHWLSKVQGGYFVNDVMIDMSNNRKSKNVFELSGVRYKINDDACDSAGIAMFGVVGDQGKLELET